MPNILTINAGSTSIKYKLFGMPAKAKEDPILKKEGGYDKVENYEAAIKQLFREVGNLPEIRAVAHRVVHGGSRFIRSTIVDKRVMAELETMDHLAPLHNPFNILGIKLIGEYLPDIPQIAVFDTSFYAKLPEVASTYALPRDIAEHCGIKRYGFHGTSHEYAMQEAAKVLEKDPKKVNLITCHLGGGWSITAIKKGQAIDTSMGFTPMEGLVMMTRSGDIDPGIIFELIEQCVREEQEDENKELSSEDYPAIISHVKDLLNNRSGIKGISGGIGDYKDLLTKVSLGISSAVLAFDIAVYHLVKYIGAYFAVLDGKVDALVYTGRIGAGNPLTRKTVQEKTRFLGKIPHIAIEPNEELMMARKAINLLSEK